MTTSIPISDPAVSLERLGTLIRQRRTNLRIDPQREVPRWLIEELCQIATWAPNHKRNWPWRFAVFSGDGRERLGNTIADSLDPATFDKPEKITKFRTKYLRAPSMLVVGAVAGESEIRTVENRDAVAAATQNILLAATAAGLASFWASGHPDADAAVAELCGWEPRTAVVSVMYLGWPIEGVSIPARPTPQISWID